MVSLAFRTMTILDQLIQLPSNHEELLEPTLLRKFPFDVGYKFFPLVVHLVLRVEERAALLCNVR